jgi:hypothetical protein
VKIIDYPIFGEGIHHSEWGMPQDFSFFLDDFWMIKHQFHESSWGYDITNDIGSLMGY